ncbi:MAG: dihydroorotate dehydrogenase [Thermoguttaceae bacterium]|nr:dihydroorotate dehydrogenase [Thermoguttaceae bacterium]
MSLSVRLGSVELPNPILTASGAFGYAKEMARLLDLSRLGGIVPKTVTVSPRPGNKPPRTVETTAGLLNAIGLDNDGINEFVAQKLPYLRTIGAPIIVSVAAKSIDDCKIFGEKLNDEPGIAAVELNVSCPNVSGGVDYGTNPALCEKMTAEMRKHLRLPFSVKLSPNVTNIAEIAKAAEAGGADMITAVNTCYGLSVDWRRRKPRLGNGCGGFSGPAIKPIALRCVWQISKAVKIPIIGVGGIACVDDVFEFLVAGASAVEIGTANFYRPDVTTRIIDALPGEMEKAGISNLSEIIGTLEM